MPADRPNILLIMADQLTPRVLGCEGGPIPTPGLDRLYESGVVFERAITPYPVCSPARASLVTGLYPHTHGIVHNVMSQDYPAIASSPHDRGITAGDQTTEGLLHAAGYRTIHRGKWHLSEEPLPYYAAWYREMQEYAVEMHPAFRDAIRAEQSMDWYGWRLPVAVAPVVAERFSGAPPARRSRENWRRFDEFIGEMGRLLWPEQMTYDYRVTSEAIRCIEDAADDDRPFMITCSLNNPHDPNVVPNPYYDRFNPDRISLPASWRTGEERYRSSLSWYLADRLGEEGVREFLRVYYAQVALTDAQILRLLNALERRGIERNTLVVFVGDHGDMVGGHGMIWKSTDAFYDELVRVPLVVRWPGHLDGGRDGRCVSLVDVMPTLLEAAGVREERPIQGRSLLGGDPAAWPALSVSQRFSGHDSTTRKVTSEDRLSIMMRTPTRKFVRFHDGEEELFDLERDPDELVNRATDPDRADERGLLVRHLVDWMRATDHPHVEQYEAIAG